MPKFCPLYDAIRRRKTILWHRLIVAGFNSQCNINIFLFSTLVNEYWTLHDLPTKPEFRDEYIVVLLTKIMRGGEYDVMIIDAVQTYFLFRGGEYNTMLAWFEPTLLYGM